MTTYYLNDDSVFLLIQLCECDDHAAMRFLNSASINLKKVSDEAFIRLLPWIDAADYGLALRCVTATLEETQNEKGKT